MGSSASASGPHHRLPCRHLQVTFQIHGLRQLSEHAQRLNLWKNNLGLLRNLLQHSGNPSWFLLNASKDTRSALDPSEKPTKSPSLREEVSCPNSQKSSTQPPRCQTPRTENKKNPPDHPSSPSQACWTYVQKAQKERNMLITTKKHAHTRNVRKEPG